MSLVSCCLHLSNGSLVLAKESFGKIIFESEFSLGASIYQSKTAAIYLRHLNSPSFLRYLSNFKKSVQVKCSSEWPLKTQFLITEFMLFGEQGTRIRAVIRTRTRSSSFSWGRGFRLIQPQESWQCLAESDARAVHVSGLPLDAWLPMNTDPIISAPSRWKIRGKLSKLKANKKI